MLGACVHHGERRVRCVRDARVSVRERRVGRCCCAIPEPKRCYVGCGSTLMVVTKTSIPSYRAVSLLSPARRAKAYPNERFRRNRIGIYASENLT